MKPLNKISLITNDTISLVSDVNSAINNSDPTKPLDNLITQSLAITGIMASLASLVSHVDKTGYSTGLSFQFNGLLVTASTSAAIHSYATGDIKNGVINTLTAISAAASITSTAISAEPTKVLGKVGLIADEIGVIANLAAIGLTYSDDIAEVLEKVGEDVASVISNLKDLSDKLITDINEVLDNNLNQANEISHQIGEITNEVISKLENSVQETIDNLKTLLSDDDFSGGGGLSGGGGSSGTWYPSPPPLPRDPLSLDLNHDGVVNTLSKEKGVHFDLDNSGFAEKTAWIAPEDGLLVLDRNGNGQIDGGAELFGTETQLQDGSFAINGFEALKEFDTNGDGVIDASDAIFADLRVWQDSNSDGLVQEGELKSLTELGITKIATDYIESTFTDAQNVEHREVGSFIDSNSHDGVVNTLWFDSDTVQSIPVDVHQGTTITISDEIVALPDAVGFGNVYGLHEAMQRDESGELKALVQAFVSEADAVRRHGIADQLLQVWAKQAEIDPDSRGGVIDARHVATMEAFWGQKALQDNLFGRYATSVEASYQQLLSYTYAQLALESRFSDIWKTVHFDEHQIVDFSSTTAYFVIHLAKGEPSVTDDLKDFLEVLSGITPDSHVLHDSFKEAMESRALSLPFAIRETIMEAIHSGDDVLSAGESNHYLSAGDGNDRLIGSSDSDLLFGEAGNDVLDGQAGKDLLDGGAGDDVLNGGEGNDMLIGGTGSDKLSGGAGDDTYLYRLGDGSDVIDNRGGGEDRLVLIDVASSQVLVSRSDTDLLLHLPNDDVITVQGYFIADSKSDAALSSIQFSDDVQWDVDTVKALVLQPVLEHNQLYGYVTDDVITGSAGDDVLFGNAGDDVLTGGKGNDVLQGGNGNDIYVYTSGDGVDIIDNAGNADAVDTVKLLGIAVQDVTLSRQFNNAVLRFSDGGSLTLRDYFTSDDVADTAVDRIVFADGTVWTVDNVRELVMTGTDTVAGDNQLYGYATNDVINGLAGNDVIYAGAGDDVITGGSGNDLLYGGKGADVYRYVQGDGSDVITTGDSVAIDTLQFLDIRSEDVHLINDNNDLKVNLIDGASIRVVNYFANDGSTGAALKNISFSDGDWDVAHVKAEVLKGSKHSETLTGYGTDDVIYAGSGNDKVYGNDGDDLLYGGTGHDTLYGGKGADRLYGGSGDDVLVGNQGNDVLSGGSGNDVYHYYNGDGSDVICQKDAVSGDVDVLELHGIRPFMVTVSQVNNNLLLTLHQTNETITLEDYFVSDTHNISEIRFDNGVTWNTQSLVAKLPAVSGGNDIIYSSIYDDMVVPLAGDDMIVYHLGDGHDRYDFTDVITATDRLMLKGVTPDAVQLQREGENLQIRFTDDVDSSITIINHYQAVVDGKDSALDMITFEDGTVWQQSYINYLGNGGIPSHAPQATDLDNNVHATTAISFTIDLNEHFSDVDNDKLNYQVQLANGESLPEWLRLDAEKGLLVGTAPLGTEGFSFTITATDTAMLSASKTLLLDLQGNHAPEMVSAQESHTVRADSDVMETLDLSVIHEVDGEALTITLTQADSSELPSWLHFDAQTGVITGHTPVDSQTLQLKLTATDSAGLAVSDLFSLSVNATPVLVHGFTHLHAEEGSEFQLQLPLQNFVDPENDNLQYQLTQVDGSTLPDWLHFDNTTGALTGNAPIGSSDLALTLVATDIANNQQTADVFLDLTAPPEILATPWYGGELSGKDGNDSLTGSWFNDRLYGNAGDDVFIAKLGNDDLIGGKGNDLLNGGWGNDHYYFSSGDGKDTIIDDQGTDSLIFIDKSVINVGLKRDGDNLVLVFDDNTEDEVTIKDWYHGKTIEQFEFSDKKVAFDSINLVAKSLIDLESPSFEVL